jgi:HEAT repeat protein
MLIPSAIARQHSAETTLLARFVAGDPEAAHALFRLLGSNDRASVESVLEVISNAADLLLWQRLLHHVARHRPLDCTDGLSPAGPGNAERAYTTLVDLFLKGDSPPAVIQIKAAALSEGLTESEPGIRHTAATLLGLQGDARAVNVLIEAAGTGRRDCQLKAVAALGQLKDERGGMALVAALASDDEEVHWAASQALHALKEAALPALIQTLKAPKPHVRWHAVCGLGDIGDVQAAGKLANALWDDDFSVPGSATSG